MSEWGTISKLPSGEGKNNDDSSYKAGGRDTQPKMSPGDLAMLDQIQRSQAKGLLEARESFSRTKQAKNQAAAGTLARR